MHNPFWGAGDVVFDTVCVCLGCSNSLFVLFDDQHRLPIDFSPSSPLYRQELARHDGAFAMPSTR